MMLFNDAGDGGAGGGGAGGAGDAGGAGGAGGTGGAGDAGGAKSSLLNSPDNTKPWWSDVPEPLRTPYVTQSKDLASFIKSANDTKSMVGANVIKLPGADATDEERAAFLDKLGRPKAPDAYKHTVQIPEGVMDESILAHMRSKFHEVGLTEAQGNTILDEYLGTLGKGVEQSEAMRLEAIEKGTTALRAEWGEKFDNNVKTAQLAIREHGGEEILQKLEATGLANDPVFIKFLYKAGVAMLDDDALGGDEGGKFTGTVMGAQQEIERLKTDKEFQDALQNRQHSGHNAAVNRWAALFKTAYPGNAEE